jgi:parvulin-like peptidyl-prolyl isomerase
MHLRLWIAAALLVLLSTAACSSATATPTTDETFATVTPGGDKRRHAAAEATVADVTPVPTVAPPRRRWLRPPTWKWPMSEIQQPTGDAAATVNDVAVPTTRYLEFLYLRLNTVTSQYGLDWSDESNLPILRQIESQVLDELIDNELLGQLATQEGVDVDAQAVSDLDTQIRAQVLSSGQYADWDAFMKANGLSDDTYQLIIEESVLLDQMMTLHAPVEDVEQVHAQHILVSDEATAEDLLAQIKDGADFGELAKTYSLDTGSAEDGGDLGWFPRGIMVTEFEDAAFALEPGEVSDVVATDYGYHIIKVLEKEVRPLDESLAEEAQNQTFLTWLGRAAPAADVVILTPTQDSGTPEAGTETTFTPEESTESSSRRRGR